MSRLHLRARGAALAAFLGAVGLAGCLSGCVEVALSGGIVASIDRALHGLIEPGAVRPASGTGVSAAWVSLDGQSGGFTLPGVARGGLWLEASGPIHFCSSSGTCWRSDYIPTADQKGALLGTAGTPGAGNKYVTDSDSRMLDARIPTDHAGTHVTGGGDTIANAAAGGSSGLMSGSDKTKLDSVSAGAAALSDATPQPNGSASPGVATAASRADHVHAGASSVALSFYGSSADGACAVDGTNTFTWASKSGSTYTTSREPNCASMTLTNNSIVTGVYAIKVAGTLSIASGSKIHADGLSASGSSRGGDPATPQQLGVGGTGGNGGTGSGSNVGATSANFAGGNGGAGGDGTGGRVGGTGGTATDIVAAYGHKCGWQIAVTGQVVGNGATPARVGGGAAGAAGGGDGTNSGGAGGNGGGVLVIAAFAVQNSGTISANGGDGGSPAAGNTGGGGGGGGGYIGLTYRTISGSSPTVTGGAKGTAHGAGAVDGVNGSAGQYCPQVM